MSVAPNSSNTIPESELPPIFRQPGGDLVPGAKNFYTRRVEILKDYVPMPVSLDALPPYLSNRNHPNTKFVPPTLFFGFEFTDEDEFWNVIWPNLGGLLPRRVFGLNAKTVEIVILDNNVHRWDPYPQEVIDKVAEALGHPPKVYVSIEHASWGIRSHYDYTW